MEFKKDLKASYIYGSASTCAHGIARRRCTRCNHAPRQCITIVGPLRIAFVKFPEQWQSSFLRKESLRNEFRIFMIHRSAKNAPQRDYTKVINIVKTVHDRIIFYNAEKIIDQYLVNVNQYKTCETL